MKGSREERLHMPRGLGPPVIAVLAGFATPTAAAGQELSGSSEMAAELAMLRTEINELDAALRSRRNLSNATLRGLAMRAGELGLAEDGERVKVKALEAEIAEIEAANKTREQRSVGLRDAVGQAVDILRKVVQASIPYKKEARLAALTGVADELESGRIEVEEAAARVWRFIEDEKRLASTVAQATLSIVLEGDTAPTLVRAVRVGTVAIFVFAGENRWGRIVRGRDGAYHYRDLDDRAQIAEVERLFAAVEKQIRQGRYRLPLFDGAEQEQ